jgi:hypothetical protein
MNTTSLLSANPEAQLRSEIQDLTRRAPGISWAIGRISDLLRQKAGLALFVVEHHTQASGSLFSRPEVRDFLGSAHASKLLYTVPLAHNGVESGRLMAAFADPPFSPGAARGLAQFIGQQLATLTASRRDLKVPA